MTYEHWIGYGPGEILLDRLIESDEITESMPAEKYFPTSTENIHKMGTYRVELISIPFSRAIVESLPDDPRWPNEYVWRPKTLNPKSKNMKGEA